MNVFIDRSSPTFALTCPVCDHGNPLTTSQTNNFDGTDEIGAFRISGRHVSTTRKFICLKCEHAWSVTTDYAG